MKTYVRQKRITLTTNEIQSTSQIKDNGSNGAGIGSTMLQMTKTTKLF